MPGSTSTNNANYEVFNHELGHNLGSPHNISIEGGWRCTIGGTIMGSRVRTLDGFNGDQYSSHSIELAMNYRNDPIIKLLHNIKSHNHSYLDSKEKKV